MKILVNYVILVVVLICNLYFFLKKKNILIHKNFISFLVLRSFVKFYDEIFYTRADPRIRDKFLMGDPAPVLIILMTIFVLLKVCHKKIMESRKPLRFYNLEHAMNYVYAGCSIYVFVKCCKLFMFHYSWTCEKVDSTDSPLDLEVR